VQSEDPGKRCANAAAGTDDQGCLVHDEPPLALRSWCADSTVISPETRGAADRLRPTLFHPESDRLGAARGALDHPAPRSTQQSIPCGPPQLTAIGARIIVAGGRGAGAP
jgi:hypothetical protein